MKKILLLLVGLLTVVSAVAQTELYNRYSSRTDVVVKCVNKMQLDSTSQIEVTILEAVDDESWNWILDEFNIGKQSADAMSVMFTMRDRHQPSRPAPITDEKLDQENSCYVGVDFKNQAIYVFAAISGTPPDSLIKYLITKMINQH